MISNGMTETNIAVLRGLKSHWKYIGESKRTWYRPPYRERWPAPRHQLQVLRSLGLVQVRTVTVNNWHSEPPTEERQGSWIEARLTTQGEDVKYDHDERYVTPGKYPWLGEDDNA